MIILGNRLKLNKLALVIALIHWGISFASDRLVFTYRLLDTTNRVSLAKAMLAWGAKLVFLALLLVMWQLIMVAFLELRSGNVRLNQYMKYTFIYLAIMLVFFILLFPGLWRMDEFGILKNAINILPHFWQGYLTSVFYIFALMLVPNPAGVVFVQVVVISLIVGYIIYKCSHVIEHRGLVYVLYVPFLLFPVIDSNFYPIRMSLYAFLELLYAFELFFIKYEKREIKKKNIWLLAVLAGIIICWRTEAIYYIILAPLTFFILFYRETSRKLKIEFMIAVVVIAGLFTSVQILGNKMDSKNDYELTSIVLPITPLVNEAYENGDQDILETIDKVLDTSLLINGYKAGESGISIYWNHTELRRNYTSEDFSDMKSAYYQLIMKYPSVFLIERLKTFIGSTGLLNETETLFEEDTQYYYVDFRETYHYKAVPFRSNMVKLLEFTDNETLHNIIYSFIPQAIFLIGICVVLLIKKKWGYFFLCGTICAKIPLIFLTAPSMLFMYYYSIYLIGAFGVGMIGVIIVDRMLKKTNQNERSGNYGRIQ
ncbi:hypothetical protein C8E03_11056 [Lachnotalea glycerini]|uniref:Uncharacterized protein n=1 Tax=Lachnotalea glycerini TaxID=1763509 RepID=A0A318EIW5_9FIRM|nr:hypothetical protein [Lachnotalea glycerini]PXV87295.1 hypothetical protein C8E03_11056 [Lachnotalea glycerini]